MTKAMCPLLENSCCLIFSFVVQKVTLPSTINSVSSILDAGLSNNDITLKSNIDRCHATLLPHL